jgi:hypothetical protein
MLFRDWPCYLVASGTMFCTKTFSMAHYSKNTYYLFTISVPEGWSDINIYSTTVR